MDSFPFFHSRDRKSRGVTLSLVRVALKRAVGFVEGWWVEGRSGSLSAESVEGASLALEGVDDVHGGDGLALRVLAVRDGVADDVLQEHLCTYS